MAAWWSIWERFGGGNENAHDARSPIFRSNRPMRIGILSDSHGRAVTTRRAVAMLIERGAELLIHLGDLETEEVIDELVGRNARIVLGNCDWDERDLTRYAENVGVAVDHPLGRLTIDGRAIAFTHGHLEREMKRAMAEKPDYLLHGHTHEVRDEIVGKTRIINPGALFRAPRYTAALLDVRSGELVIVDLGKER
jgi:uncharacterized protein